MNRKYVASFPVDIRREPEQLLDITKLWISESPHSPFRFSSFKDNREDYISRGHVVKIKNVEIDDEKVLGVSYTKPGEKRGSIWTTRVVGSKNENRFQIGVEVLYSGDKLPYEAKKPSIINKIISSMAGDQGRDGNILIPTLNCYSLVDNLNSPQLVDYIKSLLTGREANNLPIIYLSHDYYGISPLNSEDARNLGEELAGLAHVIIEPHRLFTKKINSKSNIAAHSGAIGIHWANNYGKELILPVHLVDYDGKKLDSKEILKLLVSKIRENGLDRNLGDVHWDRIQKLENILLVEKLKKDNSNNNQNNELIELYELMLKEREEELEEIKIEKSKLEGLIRNFNTQIGNGNHSNNRSQPLTKGIETGYQGEVLEVLDYAIENSLKSMPDVFQRKKEVLTQIHENLKPLLVDSQKEAELIELKNVLNYRKFNSRVRRGLQNLGFEVEEGGKHIKIKRNGITGTIAVSSSDEARGSENRFSDIRQKFY